MVTLQPSVRTPPHSTSTYTSFHHRRYPAASSRCSTGHSKVDDDWDAHKHTHAQRSMHITFSTATPGELAAYERRQRYILAHARHTRTRTHRRLLVGNTGCRWIMLHRLSWCTFAPVVCTIVLSLVREVSSSKGSNSRPLLNERTV